MAEMTTATKTTAELNDHWRMLNHRRLRAEIAFLWTGLMIRNGLTRADLAKLLGCAPSRVTELLSGNENLTLETIADVTLVLGGSAHMRLRPLIDGDSHAVQKPEPEESPA